MEIKQISKWVVITGTLFIWIVKFLVRPFFELDEPARFFFNIMPNLAGSFLIPFGACWFFYGRNSWVAKIFSIRSSYDLRMVCLIGFIMLVVNEYLQQIPVFGRTFDYFDIIFSFFGLLLSYFVYSRLQLRYDRSFN
ncbi:MAG TPA: hypothetical protein PLU37_05290 [Chitinophagaceae bacterium]|nr:hypothetical protein [Chitinophagaceae bacterium]MCB9054951.1 hypothetical protein [Chitinophagales bacterium]HPG10923.1 hypothetical protein [Chitinophagaceae bacterium]HRX93218.1 hypothetical protein [Chitinophagaceae bacterium]